MEYCRFGTLKQLIDEHGTLPLRCGKFERILCVISKQSKMYLFIFSPTLLQANCLRFGAYSFSEALVPQS